MKKEEFHLCKWRPPVGVVGVLSIVVVIWGATGCMIHQDNQAAISPEAAAAKPAGPAAKRQALTGAELYAVNCNRCHPERSPVERNVSEWQTILIHMRVRANLPAAQANAILEYLQANSGN